MTHFNEHKSEIFLYHTVELLKSYISFTVAKAYVVTGAHYIT